MSRTVRKARESLDTSPRSGRASFRWTLATFARDGPAAENRGVPGSSPGLAIEGSPAIQRFLQLVAFGGGTGSTAAVGFFGPLQPPQKASDCAGGRCELGAVAT